MTSAVLIIDVQNDFTSENGFYLKKHSGGVIIKNRLQNIITFLEQAKRIMPVICVFSNYRENQFGMGTSLCIPGTDGHEISISSDLYTCSFSKTNHSAISSDELNLYLKSENIKRLFIAGFLPEYCVSSTARDAKQSGYQVYILQDCVGIADERIAVMEKILKELSYDGIVIINTAEYFKLVNCKL